jgi:microcystin-dependent protein
MAIYQVQNETLPEGICELITSEQARLNIFSENQYVDVPETNSGIYISATPPTDPPTDNAHDLAWLELDGNGRPTRLYKYQAAWLSLHPLPTGSGIFTNQAIVTFTTGVAPNVRTFVRSGYDETTTDLIDPVVTAGPFWEVVYAGRFLVGAGNTPTVNPAIGTNNFAGGTALTLGDEYGEEEHLLTEKELCEHQHWIAKDEVLHSNTHSLQSDEYAYHHAEYSNDNSYAIQGQADEANVGLTSKTGDGETQNNMPQCVAVHFLVRTARLYFVR